MSVYKKLMDARIKLQSMTLKKSGRNNFAKYDYFELGDFIVPIQKIFAEVGLCGTVSFTAELATLTIVNTDGEGKIEFTSPMSSADLKGCHSVQNLGAVQTYLRRYLWVNALEIVEHDALDATTGDNAKPEQKKKLVPTKDYSEATTALRECETIIALQTVWGGLSVEEKKALLSVKDEVKNSIQKTI